MRIRGRYDTRDVFLAKINWILILVAQDTFFLLNPLGVWSVELGTDLSLSLAPSFLSVTNNKHARRGPPVLYKAPL